MLAPARMPVAAGKKMANTEKNDSPSRKSGLKFSKKILALRKRVRETGNEVNIAFMHFSVFVMKMCTGLERVSYSHN